ncbi:hypothetical protein OU798_16135 [Prolixibacteraceae bacterium Z1-6]|uniref:DUF4175 domain-containing protein n=1 Tax=Draconibacterium aestuarii TaxID=2998507 RepID=A0A9X3F7B0_9BACT|nr:hypothetical protein [Prolixibacteraceae bacterium Z1-6]
MTENFNILVNKLNSFKLKYYLFQLVKGLVLSAIILLLLYTVFSVVEYFVYLSSDVRKLIFYGLIIFSTLLILQFVGIPVLRLLHILKPIDLKSSSSLIQKHFSDIKDKLLNIIELADFNDNKYSNEIVLASIDQKINELKVFDFNDAVQFKNIRNIGMYLIISILMMVGIAVSNKNVFTDSTNRLLHYNQEFVKPAPFAFELINTSLKAKKGDSYIIQVNAEGDEIPKIVYINIEGNNYLMKTNSAGSYQFEMASVINPVTFYFTDLKYKSDSYNLKLLPKPGIINFTTGIYPPKYTGLQNLFLDNIGDVQIPNGTKVEWRFNGIDVDSLYVLLNDSVKLYAAKEGDVFQLEKRFYKSGKYNVFIRNKVTEPELALSYSVDVIPDLFPEIDVMQVKDSMRLTRFFFKGVVGDDYGFSKLTFHYNINNSDSTIAVPFVKYLTDQEFYFSYDFKDLPDTKGAVSYYFSVTDNDVINGYKTTTSNSYLFEFPNREELLANEAEQFRNIEKMFEESQTLAKEINDDIKNLQLKNMETNNSDWEKSQMVSDIVQKQNKLEQLYNKIKQDNESLNNYMNSFDQHSEEMMEKQKQIEELLDEVFTDELRELMEEFNKLAENFDSKNLNQLAKDMDLTMEDLQKQLDKNLEMLKKLKMEQKLQNVIDEVNKMADEEEKMAKEVNEKKNYEETKEKVEQHQEGLKDLRNQLKETLEINKEHENPMNFDDFSEDFEEIDKSMENSKENLDKKNKKKSSSGLKNTSEQLQNMAFGMQQMLDMNTQKQNQENIQNLRQILSNLILLSFTQEEVLVDLERIDAKDPSLIQLNQKQKRIVDQSKIVRDSLYSLAMRTPQISSMVNNELVSMELNLSKAKDQMEEALFPSARSSQQFVITAANNMALILNEALENLEKMQANSKPGDQQCENPGQGSSGMGDMKKQSESMKEQLQKMIDEMKNGNQGKMSQQMGQSLMQHEMMQQMLRDMMNNGSVGSDAKKALQHIDDLLEQNRKELMNKSINAQTIARQNLITTRLLEAEKAEMEREFEDKRESESAEDFYSNPVKFFEYKEKENYSIEYLNKNSHKLNNFYNKKYKQYLNKIQAK